MLARDIILDFDGTLIDTSPAILATFTLVLQARGVTISRDVYDNGRSYTDFLLRSRAATYRWGNARAKLATMDRDKQLQRALSLLSEYTTDATLMAAVNQRRLGSN